MGELSVFDIAASIIFQDIKTAKAKQDAILYLSILVENGLESFIEALKGECANPKEQAELEIAKLLFFITEEDLKQNKFFNTALRIAMFRDAILAQKGKLNSADLLTKRLSAIFPRKMADNLFLHAYDRLKEDAAKGQFFMTEAEQKQHFEERNKLLGLDPSQPARANKTYRSAGVETDMVPCPQCGKLKRVDKITKRFHCKNENPKCDFDQPYPFPKTP